LHNAPLPRWLRQLRETNLNLFAIVSERIAAFRSDAAGPNAGRAFRLDDGSLARLASFYDGIAGRDLVLVWTVDTAGGTMKIVRLEHV